MKASLGGDATTDTPTTVCSVLRLEVEKLALELQEGGGRLISQAAMQGVDARVVAYPVAQDILFAVAKVRLGVGLKLAAQQFSRAVS